MLLDNFLKAKSQLLEGLGIEPFHEGLQKTLLEVQQHLTGMISSALQNDKKLWKHIEGLNCAYVVDLFAPFREEGNLPRGLSPWSHNSSDPSMPSCILDLKAQIAEGYLIFDALIDV